MGTLWRVAATTFICSTVTFSVKPRDPPTYLAF